MHMYEVHVLWGVRLVWKWDGVWICDSTVCVHASPPSHMYILFLYICSYPHAADFGVARAFLTFVKLWLIDPEVPCLRDLHIYPVYSWCFPQFVTTFGNLQANRMNLGFLSSFDSSDGAHQHLFVNTGFHLLLLYSQSLRTSTQFWFLPLSVTLFYSSWYSLIIACCSWEWGWELHRLKPHHAML